MALPLDERLAHLGGPRRAMTPEQWERVKSVFQSALERTSEERHAFLGEACSGDPTVQAEVESLLNSHERAGTFIQEPLLPAPRRLVPGDHIGTYEVVRLLGSGGMGDVYLARDPRLERDVALKVLSSDTGADQERRARLLREARAVSALNHPNICTIHEIGCADGQDYICFEHIQGQRLDALLADGGLSLERLLELAVPLAEAIAYAHRKGILHRDLKPANIMVSELGIPKVLDFGLARIVPLAEPRVPSSNDRQTEAGLVMGTAAYMSPEQALGRVTDERSDIFSFGVVLYEMATGRPAFVGHTPMEVLDAVLHAEPEPATKARPDLPLELSMVVQKALRKDPSRRYQHMSELRADVHRLQTAGGAAPVLTPQRRQRRGALTLTAAAGVMVAVAAVSWNGMPARREPASAASPFGALRRPTGPLAKNSLAAYRAVTEARGLYGADRWEAALEASKRAADLDPEYAEAWALLGKIYARLASPPGFPGGSIADYRANALVAARRAVELDSSSYEGHVALALAHRNLSQIELSRAAARKAIALGPQFSEGYRVLGDTYSETTAWGCAHDRDNAAAISLERQAQSIAATDEGSAFLINILKYDKRFDEALRNADEALRRNPTSRRIRRNRAWILLEVGRLDEAERMLHEAAGDGGIRGNDRIYLAGIELRRGHLAAAAEGFRKAELSNRGHIEVARQYIEAKLPDPALVHLQQGIRSEPECAGFLLRTKAPYWSVIRSVPAARALLETYNPRQTQNE